MMMMCMLFYLYCCPSSSLQAKQMADGAKISDQDAEAIKRKESDVKKDASAAEKERDEKCKKAKRGSPEDDKCKKDAKK
jgi:hypothetical protein